MIQLEIDWLKSNHKMIHYFGLGFIQLKLNDKERVHFYTLDLPAIIPEEEIHNHRYDFNSYVLKGVLHQTQYAVVPGDGYLKEKESCKADCKIDDPGEECDIVKIGSQLFPKGSIYYAPHETFHKVRGLECITYIDRGEYMKEYAEVIRPKKAHRICPFSANTMKEDKLWEIVEKMIK